MPQHDMTTDPQTWPRPDEVDIILAAERWEATDDYEDALRDWSSGEDVCDCHRDVFSTTASYDRQFAIWLDRQLP